MQTTEQRIIARLRELAAVALMLVAIPLIASCGGGDQGGGGEGNGGGGQGGGQAGNGGGGGQPGGTTGGGGPQITDVRVIAATPDKATLDGNRTRLSGLEVREIVSERAVYVGENDAERLLVLNIGEATEVTEGQNVTVVGRLVTPKPELEERLSLNPEEAAAIEDQEVFIRARQVRPQGG